jgi:hypothetical protein
LSLKAIKQSGRQAVRQTGRQADRQTGRQADKQVGVFQKYVELVYYTLLGKVKVESKGDSTISNG